MPALRTSFTLGAICVAAVMACDFNKTHEPQLQACADIPQSSQSPNGESVLGGVATRADAIPSPISGGTLAVLEHSARTVVASVPEVNRIAIAKLDLRDVATVRWSVQEVALPFGSDPGRVVEDGAGRVHVVLRGNGSVVSIEPTSATIMEERPVCPAARGIAYEAASDVLHVVCATGELVTLPAAGGPPTRKVHVDRDLRDVVVLGNHLLVTRFRSAQVLTLDAGASILSRVTLPGTHGRTPHVAWRMTEKYGRVAIAYQLASDDPIDIRQTVNFSRSAYGGPMVSNPSTRDGAPLVVAAVATTTNGTGFGVVDEKGTAPAFDVALDSNGMIATTGTFNPVAPLGATINFSGGDAQGVVMSARQVPAMDFARIDGQEYLFVQTREPAAIHVVVSNQVYPREVMTIPLPGVSDTGFEVFHMTTPVGISCSSCHPEGGDDGHVWHFVTRDLKPQKNAMGCVTLVQGATGAPPNDRRTQSLRGGVLATVPLHWDGDMGGMGNIVNEVFTNRMGGGSVTAAQRVLVERWIQSIPRLPQRTDLETARVESGRVLFEGKGACAGCHSGAMLTNNQTLDIGRGALQVPNLISIGDRAPYLHDGCAKTLASRFDPACGGSKHGNDLTPAERADVVTYLESL